MPDFTLEIAKDQVEITSRVTGGVKRHEIAFCYEGSILSALKEDLLPRSILKCKKVLSGVKSLDLLAPAGAMHKSSMQYAELPAERLDLLKRSLPSHDLPARPVDLLKTNEPRIWLTGNQRMNLIGLFNWKDQATDEIVYEMGKLGLEDTTRYAAFDYWRDQFVEHLSDTLRQTLPGGTCRILAVRPVANYPQVLSTSRHITQGRMTMGTLNFAHDNGDTQLCS